MDRANMINEIIFHCQENRLKRSTLYNTIYVVDKLLSTCVEIPIDKLKVISMTSLLCISKIEDIYPISIKQFPDDLINHFEPNYFLNLEL